MSFGSAWLVLFAFAAARATYYRAKRLRHYQQAPGCDCDSCVKGWSLTTRRRSTG